MKSKKSALKGLLIFAIIIALCMLFSNTIVTITTPKIQLAQTKNGRIEQSIQLDSQVYFPQKNSYILRLAQQYPIVVEEVLVRPGHYVEQGETLATAYITDFDSKQQDLHERFEAKSEELLKLDMENPRYLRRTSKQVELYNAALNAQLLWVQAESAAKIYADQQGLEWDDNTNEELNTLIAASVAAYDQYMIAHDAFLKSYGRASSYSQAVFEYFNKRNAIQNEIDQITLEMTKLQTGAETLTVIKASQSGYIVEMNLESGNDYNGKSIAFIISDDEAPPVLRAQITDVGKDIEPGTQVEINGGYGAIPTKVERVGLDSDGHTYAYIEINDRMIANAGGLSRMLSDEAVKITVKYRSKNPATLLPAGAVRNEGDGTDYVFIVEEEKSGFFGSSILRVVKTPVQVLERGDEDVSIQESLYNVQIAYQEDRPLSDGCKVMEYLD